jgi:hypothetical protein
VLRAGFDVDGCDVSADMIARCRAQAEAKGLAPTLWVHPLMLWTAEGRAELPGPWSAEHDRRPAPDGFEYSLWSRMLEVDPIDQSMRVEMRIEKRRDGELVAEDERPLPMRMWFRDELVLMLWTAGFSDLTVRGGYDDEEPRPDHDLLVFIARK